MTEGMWLDFPAYTPTVMVSCFPGHPLSTVAESLAAEGPDVRIVLESSGIPAAAVPEPAKKTSRRRSASMHSRSHGKDASLIAAARSVQPDVLVMAGNRTDEWAVEIVRELRSDPVTHELGLVLFPCVSIPEEMEITPMTGPDAWVFLDARPAQALETIRRTVREALEGRLEWAQRDWSASDRRKYAIKAMSLHIDEGCAVTPEELALALYGSEHSVDIRILEGTSSHLPGWRFGGEERFGRPLLARHEAIAVDGNGVGEHRYTLYSRSSRLLMAASNSLAEVAGGWPTVE